MILECIFILLQKKAMPSIGKSNPIIDILHRKTKIRKEDIIDLFRVLPESMAEAFLIDQSPLNIGPTTTYINKGGRVAVKLTQAFKSSFRKQKQAKKTQDL